MKVTRIGYVDRFLYGNRVCELSGKRIEPYPMELYRDDRGNVYVAKYVVQKIHIEAVHVTATNDQVHRIYDSDYVAQKYVSEDQQRFSHLGPVNIRQGFSYGMETSHRHWELCLIGNKPLKPSKPFSCNLKKLRHNIVYFNPFRGVKSDVAYKRSLFLF
jgi:hypothetical protein